MTNIRFLSGSAAIALAASLACDGPEVGAGWKHSGERAGTFISVVLDDPAFPFPVRARLFQSDEDGRDWGLHWTRPKKRDDQD